MPKKDAVLEQEIEEMFRLVVEATPNGMILTDQEGKIVLVNSSAERLSGYRREELLGQAVEILVPEPLRDAHARHRADFFAHRAVRPMGCGSELFLQRKDGAQIPIELGLNAISTKEQHFVLASIIDITERRAAEAARVKTEMVAWVSHEFNNALAMLTTSCHVLKDDEPKNISKKRLTVYDILERTLQHLKQNVCNWLNNAKLESGRMHITPRRTPLAGLIKECVETLRPLARNKNIRIRALLSSDEDAVKADPDALSLLLANLICNAIKYTPEGGHGTVQVKPVGEGRLMISVKDNGIGIAPGEIDKILTGQRGDSGIKTTSGFGFGLAICQKLLAEHGSRLHVESSPGGGSRFFFTLPRWEGLCVAAKQAPDDAIDQGGHNMAKRSNVVRTAIPPQATQSGPAVRVLYPKEGEVITSPTYTFHIGAIPEANNVEVSIDQGDWKPCRQALGLWWYDWADYEPGYHVLLARTRIGNDMTATSAQRQFMAA